ncbi:hypothetical protein ABBQ32_002778 [Trebouxia sp. C0010 RCD-2024]
MAPSLIEVLHEVPPLWDALDSGSLKTLLSSDMGLRCRAKQHVQCIRTGNHRDADDVIRSTWTQHVQVLHLRGSTLRTAQLSKGDGPKLQCFTLLGSQVTAGIIHALSGKWPLLQGICSVNCVFDHAAMSALTVADWPLLRTLHLSPFRDAMPDLVNGRWPQLRDLSIGLDMPGHICVTSLGEHWSDCS